MANKEEKPEGKESSWKDFIYNPRTGEFIGRTASSWALIFLFYVVFYGFLAGMFSLTMWVMLQTLDDYTPRYRDRVANPGLMIRPSYLDIMVNRSNPQQYNKYVSNLEKFLQEYNDSVQEQNTLCQEGVYNLQDDKEEKSVCQFKRSQLRQCSGLADTNFGYAEGQPCVLIKMNRVIGLKPRGDPYINCTAKREMPLQMQYFPAEGRFDKMYFPYYGKKAHPNYVQPVVAVKLLLNEQDYDTYLTIECKVEGSDLRNNDDRDKFLGRVTFRVHVTK
ncbi:sodium/potassium-transporting ATPase subunit beta-3b [Colossoma macropomum]|uniref:sodium/potassium-transporting ATPase subunit beta-3b n=1 Tax=Colossoma macropomum TaxID=42526 RepID=UPI001864E240|nr:sodium/potassium-transporting ATPase subunit beta-3b [Colossoma macropomum]